MTNVICTSLALINKVECVGACRVMIRMLLLLLLLVVVVMRRMLQPVSTGVLRSHRTRRHKLPTLPKDSQSCRVFASVCEIISRCNST